MDEKFLLGEMATHTERLCQLTNFIERTIPRPLDADALACLLDGVTDAAREQGRVLHMLEPYGIDDVQTALIRNQQNFERGRAD